MNHLYKYKLLKNFNYNYFLSKNDISFRSNVWFTILIGQYWILIETVAIKHLVSLQTLFILFIHMRIVPRIVQRSCCVRYTIILIKKFWKNFRQI